MTKDSKTKDSTPDARDSIRQTGAPGVWTNVILAVGSIVVALIAGEIMLRVLEPAYMPKEVSIDTHGFWQPADIVELIYENRPNATLTDTKEPEIMRQSEKDGHVHYDAIAGKYIANSLGMRGLEPKNPKTKPRVLILGDSVGFGLFLNEPEAFNAHLTGELELHDIYAEILNASVVGYTTRLQSIAYRKKHTNLDEDLLIMVWCMNDVADDVSAMLHINWHELLLKHFPLFDPQTRKVLYQHSYIFRQLVKGYVSVGYNLYPEKFHFETHWDYPWILGQQLVGEGGEHWQRTKGFLKEISDEAKRRGIRMVQVVVPLQIQIYQDALFGYYDPAPAVRLLKGAGKELGYEVLDLTPAFLEQADQHKLFVDLTHVSAAGAQIMAKETARFLAEKQLLPTRGKPAASQNQDANPHPAPRPQPSDTVEEAR